MRNTRKVFIHSPGLGKYSYPDSCPFSTARAVKARETVLSMGLLSGGGRCERAPEKATREELETFHLPAYLDALQRTGKGELDVAGLGMGLGTPDCPVFPGMYDYASLASGGTLTAARMIVEGEAGIVFNPSGGYHHAGPDYAAGFCYVNDVVLAAALMADAGKRVLFLDVDVHHGDGVQNAFYDRNDVMTVSFHETGKVLFPGTGFEDETGVGDGEGYAVNVPLPVGTYDEAYLTAFHQVAVPLLGAYGPDVIILELGMDGLSGDPLAHLHLTNNVYADIIADVLDVDRPILATGGGGYNIENTARGWALAWSVLCGDEAADMGVGMGGVMFETTEWSGGLRDRILLSDAGRRAAVDTEVNRTIEEVRSRVFPYHGLAV